MSTEDTGAPNLDAMRASELLQFARRVNDTPMEVARELFPSRPRGYLLATQHLRTYAIKKAAAIDKRSVGDIVQALADEAHCEALYQRLPAFARW